MSLQTKSTNRPGTAGGADTSVRRMRLIVLLGRILPALALLAVLWVVTLVEWMWLIGSAQPQPLYTTIIAGLMSIYVLVRTVPEIRRIGDAGAGDEDRHVVTGYLDRLRGLGFRVFHDVPGDSGDIDHVIISRHGVFSIETRMRRRPAEGPYRLRYDGRAVAVAGGPSDRSAIAGPRARARQLRRILRQGTGRDFAVRAVLLYPGWYVESPDPGDGPDVWVLSPKSLPMWIKHETESLHGSEVRLAADALADYLSKYR